jgi:hypothetical protein
MEERRYFYLELPGETICLHVPAVPLIRPHGCMDAVQYPTNMVYDRAPRPAFEYDYRPTPPPAQVEPQGYPVNMICDPGRPSGE